VSAWNNDRGRAVNASYAWPHPFPDWSRISGRESQVELKPAPESRRKIMLNQVLFALALVAALALPGAAAIAAGGGGGDSVPAAPEDPDYAAGKRAVEAMNWQAALAAFNKVVAKDPGNAGAHNYLGYTYRRSGQLDLAFKQYEEALRLNPKHRGAHEYLGEAYLMVDNPAKAEEQLKVLDKICLFGCEEYDDLKKAIAAYRQKTANK
jgi:tetratricopeptide (TPR) repeat protein